MFAVKVIGLGVDRRVAIKGLAFVDVECVVAMGLVVELHGGEAFSLPHRGGDTHAPLNIAVLAIGVAVGVVVVTIAYGVAGDALEIGGIGVVLSYGEEQEGDVAFACGHTHIAATFGGTHL